VNILVTGASGLVGKALLPLLSAEGHRVLPLRRASGRQGGGPTWDPQAGSMDLNTPQPLDAVVHLAGETIAQRWTSAAKARIRASRVEGTRLLCEALAGLAQPPRALICASATGFYGDRGQEILDEQSQAGTGFLAQTCQAWEAAAAPARQRGLRVVHLRLGMVLAPRGGALAKMLPVFRFGLGGELGHGRQYWSWIAVQDVVRAVQRALRDERLHGAVNAVTPQAASNAEFTATLARVLRRPALLRVPAFALKMMLGEMGSAVLLASARVRPARLLETGFAFQFTNLEATLRQLLKSPA
jgi:uncharacterized protein